MAHLIPQDATLDEVEVVTLFARTKRETISYSADDAAMVISAWGNKSKVIVWEPERIGTGLTQGWFDLNYPGVEMETMYFKDNFVIPYWPIENRYITQIFGVNHDYYDDPCGHTGIDMINPDNRSSAVWCVSPGIVVETGYHPNGWGNFVRVNHPGSYQTIYAHLENFYAGVGEYVSPYGPPVGNMGTTGNSTGIHLHFAMKNFNVVSECNYNLIDPTPYLSAAKFR